MASLLIIDGHAILHRAYHSIPPLTVNGQVVNAIYGFYSMLIASIKQLNPTHLLVCLDSPGPTFRSTEFIGYRAKRAIPDRDLISQLPLLAESLQQATLPALAMGGFEADDLIATAVKQLSNKKSTKSKKSLIQKTIVITGDKDLMQLVSPRLHLFMPFHGLADTRLIGPAEVKARLGVSPSQVVDLKALMGDQSDNYPGVNGIGPKNAIDLLTKYKTLDNVYSHLNDLSPNLRQKLENGKNDAYLSQKLATLIENIPLKLKLSQTRWNQTKEIGLINLFKSYNFKSLINRLQKNYPVLPKSTNKPPSSQGSLF